MPTYLMFATLSPQGLQTLRVTPERLLEVNREFEADGIVIREQWALLGTYDILTVLDAPDEQTVIRLSTAMAARGSAQVETLAVIPADEFIESLDAAGL